MRGQVGRKHGFHETHSTKGCRLSPGLTTRLQLTHVKLTFAHDH
ncbi:hypothetical protein OKW42_003589 [Paraburkholderia sp. WC7.3d]